MKLTPDDIQQIHSYLAQPNQRPLGYEPNELPTAPSRDVWSAKVRQLSRNTTTFVKKSFYHYPKRFLSRESCFLKPLVISQRDHLRMNTETIANFPADHKAGFVSIVGKPNVGKSTLMNQLVGERLSIITAKAQTTRHRIMGILNGTHNGQEFQLVYSDTPGIIKPLVQTP